VESPQGRKPLGTRRQKSELVSSFCRLASPRLATADLEPGADPEQSEGTRPNKIKKEYFSLNKVLFISFFTIFAFINFC
jgi:hypothetical protein